MTTDSAGNLYVAGAFGTANGVEEFAPNCGPVLRTFVENDGNPEDPAVDGERIYLSLTGRGPSTPGAVDVFSRSTNSRIGQLTDPTVSVGVGVAVDVNHDLFWSTNNIWTLGGQVIEFRKGRMPGLLLKATRIGTDFPGGVVIDNVGNLLLIDQSNATILAFARPYKSAPFKKIRLRGSAWFCALNAGSTRLYCVDYTNASVDAYSYPAAKYLYSYDNGIVGSQGPVGIAVQPKIGSAEPR